MNLAADQSILEYGNEDAGVRKLWWLSTHFHTDESIGGTI